MCFGFILVYFLRSLDFVLDFIDLKFAKDRTESFPMSIYEQLKASTTFPTILKPTCHNVRENTYVPGLFSRNMIAVRTMRRSQTMSDFGICCICSNRRFSDNIPKPVYPAKLTT